MVGIALRRSTGLIADHKLDVAFKTICCTAIIAARPLAGLQLQEIDIYFGTPSEIEIDPQIEWIMVSAIHSQCSSFPISSDEILFVCSTLT